MGPLLVPVSPAPWSSRPLPASSPSARVSPAGRRAHLGKRPQLTLAIAAEAHDNMAHSGRNIARKPLGEAGGRSRVAHLSGPHDRSRLAIVLLHVGIEPLVRTR